MLVYSIDLPQMDGPGAVPSRITTTELLDVHGSVFGSFALERRVVVPYDGVSAGAAAGHHFD